MKRIVNFCLWILWTNVAPNPVCIRPRDRTPKCGGRFWRFSFGILFSWKPPFSSAMQRDTENHVSKTGYFCLRKSHVYQNRKAKKKATIDNRECSVASLSHKTLVDFLRQWINFDICDCEKSTFKTVFLVFDDGILRPKYLLDTTGTKRGVNWTLLFSDNPVEHFFSRIHHCVASGVAKFVFSTATLILKPKKYSSFIRTGAKRVSSQFSFKALPKTTLKKQCCRNSEPQIEENSLLTRVFTRAAHIIAPNGANEGTWGLFDNFRRNSTTVLQDLA